jgi:EAL domain-containing protein (putative c-di-GMP-specific phosphodiesterase class I)
MRILFLVFTELKSLQPERVPELDHRVHDRHVSVTAEGVETSEQLGNLQTTGCDTALGFLFSRPERPEVVERLLLDPVAEPR